MHVQQTISNECLNCSTLRAWKLLRLLPIVELKPRQELTSARWPTRPASFEIQGSRSHGFK